MPMIRHIHQKTPRDPCVEFLNTPYKGLTTLGALLVLLRFSQDRTQMRLQFIVLITGYSYQ